MLLAKHTVRAKVLRSKECNHSLKDHISGLLDELILHAYKDVCHQLQMNFAVYNCDE